MTETSFAQRVGATPGKMGLLAALSVGLVLALVLQPESAETSASATQPTAGDPRPSPPVKPTTQPARPWPVFPLDQVTRHDPFQLPPALWGLGLGERVQLNQDALEAVAEQPSQRANWIREQSVGFVLITEKEAVATIGEATVRPGDVIDGFRVVKIDTTGVYLTDEGATEP